jgi:hypothetical protein
LGDFEGNVIDGSGPRIPLGKVFNVNHVFGNSELLNRWPRTRTVRGY